MLDSNNQHSQITNLVEGKSSTQITYEDALENYRKNTDWWVIFASFDLPDFQASPLWISEKIGISVETVVEALEGLEVLGYLKKVNGVFQPITGKDFVKFDLKNRKKSDVLEEHALISRQIVNQLCVESLAAVDHRCFASNIEVLTELYSDINKAFEKAYLASQKDKNKDKILKITFTATDVLPGKERK